MKRVKLKRGDCVRITWIDSRGATTSWAWKEDADLSPCKCLSLGYVWFTSKTVIAVAPHVDSKKMEQACGVMVIPWRSVKKVERFCMADIEVIK